ncbi:MAG: hypothetical protein JJ863_23760 [Deltaproteobacteria bacterium]|nr:hypothetical protein [Deltaproteobacteria bacterium]
MADKPKKPKKIKDLKARLGRTIAPNTGKGAVVAPPGAAGAKPAAPSGGGGGGVVPPPGGGVVPPPSGGPGAPGGLVAPPFGKKAEEAKKAAAAAAADPFASSPAQPSAGPKEVRLVLDDSAVADSEVGREKKGKTFILLGLGVALGLLLGYFVGGLNDRRSLHNTAVRDGKALYEAVQEASDKLNEVQAQVRTAVEAARGGPGEPAAVDYDAMEAINRIEKPFTAGTFARKHYSLFEPQTVDALFDYYNKVNVIWDHIARVSGMTSGDERRAQLNEAAESAQNAGQMIGCIPQVADNRFQCSLGFITIPEGSEGAVQVRARRTARQHVEKTLYTGQDLSEEPEQYVILINNQQSMGVLGEQASLFADYVHQLGQLNTEIQAAVEVQGRLETSLGQIASNEELFTF